jgi:hypothetical protein
MIWMLAACGPKPLAATELYRPAVIAYTEHQRFGPLPERQVTVVESTMVTEGVAPPEGFDGAVWETIRAVDGTEEGPRLRIVVGDAGVARFAASRGGGPWLTDSPKLELPGRVKPGDTWTGEHGREGQRHTRTCVAEPTPFCESGIAATCTTEWQGRRVWMRQHWCSGQGWMGFETLAMAAGQPSSTFWSTGASRDGQPLPEIDLSLRPIPEPPRE